jgi:signal transduction histidine kinase
LVLEELGTRVVPPTIVADGIDGFIDGVRATMHDAVVGLRVFLTDRRGRLRLARSDGAALVVHDRQAVARRRTLDDRIVRILERDPLAVSIFPIDRRGHAIGVAEITASVETLEQHQRELEALIGTMSEVLRRAIDGESRRRELDLSLAWTAHELRGPLHAVRAWLEYADSGSTEVNLPIRRATDELSRITAGLQSVLSWASGQERLDEQQIDLVALVSDAVDSCVAETGEDRVVMEGSERLIVRGDPLHLRSALENLIRNALRYSTPGSKVRVTIEPREGEPAVEVENEGPGISDSERDAIFDPLTRGTDGVGTGLGLYVVGRVVERHGGTIRCFQPEEGKVSFELRLPPFAVSTGTARLHWHGE